MCVDCFTQACVAAAALATALEDSQCDSEPETVRALDDTTLDAATGAAQRPKVSIVAFVRF